MQRCLKHLKGITCKHHDYTARWGESRSSDVTRTTGWLRAAIALAGLLGSNASLLAHSGGLNKDGCHNDRRNGGYHCHNGAAATASPPSAAGRAGFAPSPSPSRAVPAGAYAPAGNTPMFRNCDQARAAGAAPVRRGDPGYGPHLDRDNDGVGCEPYRGR
jgi:hypothetical protein